MFLLHMSVLHVHVMNLSLKGGCALQVSCGQGIFTLSHAKNNKRADKNNA